MREMRKVKKIKKPFYIKSVQQETVRFYRVRYILRIHNVDGKRRHRKGFTRETRNVPEPVTRYIALHFAAYVIGICSVGIDIQPSDCRLFTAIRRYNCDVFPVKYEPLEIHTRHYIHYAVLRVAVDGVFIIYYVVRVV